MRGPTAALPHREGVGKGAQVLRSDQGPNPTLDNFSMDLNRLGLCCVTSDINIG